MFKVLVNKDTSIGETEEYLGKLNFADVIAINSMVKKYEQVYVERINCGLKFYEVINCDGNINKVEV